MTFDSEITSYINQLRTSDADDAFHHLLEIDTALVPQLIAAYQLEGDPHIRIMLIEIIGEHRRLDDIGFLAKALQSNNPDLWKAALDALVKIDQPASVLALIDARNKLQAHSPKIEWIDEAIQQIDDAQS